MPISLSLWIPSTALNQRRSSISSSFTLSHLLVYVSVNQPTNQTLRTLSNAPSCNIKYRILLSEPISINLALSNFMFFPPLSHTLSIHSHICFQDFCLYKYNENELLEKWSYLDFMAMSSCYKNYKCLFSISVLPNKPLTSCNYATIHFDWHWYKYCKHL